MYHCGSLMIEHIYVSEITLNEVFLSCREDFIVHDNNFCLFSFLSLINIFKLIETDSCINT